MLPISIQRIDITDGSARYSDQWIQPHFTLDIGALSGAVERIAATANSRARFTLDGKVDRYAPFRVAGEVNFFAPAAYSDVTMSFKGVDLTTATPYSGHFAGYKIKEGKITADVKYHVENRQLSANPHFVIDQLELGDRVDSPDAVKLPIKLALVLLKDRHGVIDLGLPVSGSLDDPKFSVGLLIWKAFINVIEKAATAPFALIGRMFGGGEQIKEIDFDPGSSSLDVQARQRLAVVAKALAERTSLRLDVPSSFAPDLDRSALGKELVRQRLLALKRSELAAHHHYDDTVDASTLDDPREHFRLLLAEYRTEMGSSAALPEDLRAVATSKKSRSTEPPSAAAMIELETALAAHVTVSDTDLQSLGQRRARAVQDAVLAAGGIDPSRLFILAASATAPHGARVQLELGLR